MRYSINLNVTLQEDFLNREVSTVSGFMQDGVFINFSAATLLSVSVAPRAQILLVRQARPNILKS